MFSLEKHRKRYRFNLDFWGFVGGSMGLFGWYLQYLGHSPRMCYQHPNGVMSLLEHLASVRFTMKAGLFVSDFTGASHIGYLFRQNGRFGRALWQFPTSAVTSWTEHINVTRQTTDFKIASSLRFVALNIFKVPCFGAWVLPFLNHYSVLNPPTGRFSGIPTPRYPNVVCGESEQGIMMGIAVAAWIETHSHGIPKVQRSKSLPSKRPLKGPQIDVKDLRRWVPSSFWPSTR